MKALITSKKAMSSATVVLSAIFAAALLATPAGSASADNSYYYVPSGYQYQYQPVTTTAPTYYNYGGSQMTEAQLIDFLRQLIVQLQAQLAARQNSGYYYNYSYPYNYGDGYVIGQPRSSSNYSSRDEEPDVETDRATDIDDDSARLEGFVDMNDFEDGEVFFVYGTDRSQIEDVEDEYDSYRDVDTNGDRLRKIRVDSSLDDSDDYSYRVSGLNDDTRYYFNLCVGYEDEDNDDVLTCGDMDDFRTDN